jgi:hypothetical protein
MNFEFIEGGKTGDEVVKFGGVGVTDKKVVYDEGEGSGVGMVAEEHGGGSFREAVLGEKGDKTKLG